MNTTKRLFNFKNLFKEFYLILSVVTDSYHIVDSYKKHYILQYSCKGNVHYDTGKTNKRMLKQVVLVSG